MNPINLEDRFRCHVNRMDSFWFTHFAMTHPKDRDRINDCYFNSDNITSEKVIMYCEMWKRYEGN